MFAPSRGKNIMSEKSCIDKISHTWPRNTYNFFDFPFYTPLRNHPDDEDEEEPADDEFALSLIICCSVIRITTTSFSYSGL